MKTKLTLDVAVYYPDSTEYRMRYIHPTHHAEVENISKLLKDVEFDEPRMITDWHRFVNALRMLSDQYIRSLDAVYLTWSGEIVEDSE